MMAMPESVRKKRLDGLWQQIETTHLSYLYTDDSPEKLKEKQKLEGYILDYLCIIPHEHKFSFPQTLALLTRSAHDPEFNGYRLARGWAALARYASNLLAQPWRKEYKTLRLYSGFYKHEVEGAGLIKVEEIFNVMGYKRDGTPHSLTLDGPVCPTQVTALSLDSLIAYVECQVIIQIWEEVSRCGGSCSWLEILRCRELYPCNVDGATKHILEAQRSSVLTDLSEMYSNVKMLGVNNIQQQPLKKYLPYQSSTDTPDHMLPTTICNTAPLQLDNQGFHQMQTYEPHYMQPNPNGFIPNGHNMNTTNIMMQAKSGMHPMDNGMQRVPINNIPEDHGMYCMNPLMNAINPMYRYPAANMVNPYNGGFMYQPMPAPPYIMQAPLPTYGPVRQATTLPLTNGYHYPTLPPQPYCTSVPTGQLIELDIPNYPLNHHNGVTSPKQTYPQDKVKIHGEHQSKRLQSADLINLSNNMHGNIRKIVCDSSSDNQENIRRNSAPKSTGSYSSDHTVPIPRSDTQPSLSKAREDGMGTFESWDYVFRNLENQGYSKDLGDRTNQIPSPLESKTLGRNSSRDPKRYQPTTMDLEDALHAMSLEKDIDEEMYRTAKVNEKLMRFKQENEAKAAKANQKKHIRADEREKRKTTIHETNGAMFLSENNAYNKQSDRTRLISKEEAKEKRDIDKNMTSVSGNERISDIKKVKKSVVKCLSSETDTIPNRKRSPPPEQVMQNGAVSKKASSSQGASNHQSSNQHHLSKSSQDTVDSSMKSRLVVTLHSPEKPTSNKPSAMKHSSKHSTEHKEGTGSKNKSEEWGCAACTFVNKTSKNICDVCGKSRQIGVEAMPLVSGGKECPTCTLVNSRDATICAVCEASLKHSPTYI